MDGWKERSAGGEREREEGKGQIYREREGMEGKKIKQIGMQHTTTGGWNEGGVKLGQLGVPAPGERVGSILSLSLSPVFPYTPARTRERARSRHASAYMHALPPSLSSCFSYFPSFPPSSVVSAQQPVANPETHVGRSESAANEKREREREREGGFVADATCRWIARESGFSRSRSY